MQQKTNYKEFNKTHEELLIEYLNKEEITQYLISRIPQPFTKKDAQRWIEIGSKKGVVSATTGEYENRRNVEIGYWLAQN